ncbi:MAG: hypothetical protein JWQ89_1193 [Devosia sp.]|uniref:hypothetical protein n=1 Tax=Devosia sp. TaxID=1871048 RepID=UPI00261E36EB|nr:hypothetical protein [Devosia sp.]MDB5539466.1 hypothetical protein [Devosia sp.]
MLAELFVYAASYRTTPPAFRPYLGEAIGLWARGERQTRAWAPHLANSRGLIDTTIDDFSRRRTVAVLGSGALFDIPVESLARTFARVILVDRIHLSVIGPRIDRYGNVERQWRDLSPETNPEALGLLDGIADLDWVISANLVSQVARAAPPGRERHVVDSHLDALARLECPVTLITDLDYRVFNRHGVVRDSADLLYGRQVPRTGLRWKWEVAPFGEESRTSRRVHSVAAWPDWRHA